MCRRNTAIGTRFTVVSAMGRIGLSVSVSIALAETMAASGHYNIDSASIGAQVSAAGGKRGIHRRALGRSRGGFTSKVNCLSDARGRPLAFHLTPGEAHDCKAYDALIDLSERKPKALVAHKAYAELEAAPD
jgi:hypothetical protein